MRNIKNQCIELFSTFIEIFGDQAIRSTLLVISYLLEINDKFESQLSDTSSVEESKSSEGILENETAISTHKDQQDLKEFTYYSNNKLHAWKRKDVAMILLGLFIEDVAMFLVRNPKISLTGLIEEIININFTESLHMSPYLKGRALWCASSYSESLLQHNEQT